ncbi:hypothetical protein PDJ95_29700, partial [Bacillus cereus]|nr:hypothetical protein [Bacillus cereus]
HIKTFKLPQHRLEPTISIDDAARLPRFHAIISVSVDGDLHHAFTCKMQPPVEQKYSNSSLTKQHTQLYGQGWEELQG